MKRKAGKPPAQNPTQAHEALPHYWRKLSFTRVGWYFVGLTLGVGAAAINTGNNLLYLVLGAMLAMIVTSGLLSEKNLRGVRVQRKLPKRVFVDQPFQVDLCIYNSQQRWTSLSLVLSEMNGDVKQDRPCVVFAIPPQQTVQTSYIATVNLRGLHELRMVRVTTRFPFSLFAKSRAEHVSDTLIAYPKIHDVHTRTRYGRELADGESGVRGHGGDFDALRDYREGDNLRDIVWRKAAGTQRVVVREYIHPRINEVVIPFDDIDRGQTEAQREQAIRDAASLAVHHLKLGHAVGLETTDALIPPVRGSKQGDRILDALALMTFKPLATTQHAFRETA